MAKCESVAALLAGVLFSVVLDGSAFAAGVPVGDSSLIGTLHYSDTFTLTAHSGIAGRPENVFPVGSPGITVESNYGNPAMEWTNSRWSLNSDSTPFPGTLTYPGNSGAGSNTGITQTGLFGGGAGTDWGIEYGLSDHYVVQYDAVLLSDRVDISSGPVRDGIVFNASAVDALSIFFRPDNVPDHGSPQFSVSIYNPVLGETNSGLGSIGLTYGQWANFAVRFDRTNHVIEVFVNEVSLGVLDMATFAGGVYNNWSNAAVSVGGWTWGESNIFWTDNFQVGTPLVQGDFDGDGDVDGADFIAWQTHFPTSTEATLDQGDADQDGDVDGADFSIWQASFPFAPGSEAAAPVPEPHSVLLMALVGIASLAVGRHKAT
jgi:hypothetical protein